MPVSGPESPTVNSLLIAERIFRDRDTSEWIIAGVFNSIQVNQLPYRHPGLEVFFQVTNVGQNVDLHFRVERADGEVVLEFGGPISASTPLQMVEQRVVLRNLSFAAEGKYWIQLLSREEILTQAPLYVRVMEEVSNDEDEGPDIK